MKRKSVRIYSFTGTGSCLALKLAEKLGVAHMHVTLADERHYACATVIIES